MKFLEILNKVVKYVAFFVDNLEPTTFYAYMSLTNGSKKIVTIESKYFNDFLFQKSVDEDEDGNGLNPQKAIKYIRSYLENENRPPEIEVFKRVSGDLKKGLEYDLINIAGDSVKISDTGWKISPKKRKFISMSLSVKQVEPVETTKSLEELLRPFVHLTKEDFKLFMVWLVQCFSTGNHFALLLMAERGSGKSTLTKLIKKIVDPDSIEICAKPSKLEDLCVFLGNTYMSCFDNVGNLTKDESDLLCGAITSTASVKRALFTDNELKTMKLQNVIVMNGVQTIPEESDLAERFLVLNLKKLKGAELRTEREFWDDFEAARPEILGAIFDVLSKAMKLFPKASTAVGGHRMADAFTEMLVIAEALGIPEEEFRTLISDNVSRMNEIRGDTPLVEAIKEYVNRPYAKTKESGYVSEIYTAVKANYSGNKSQLPNSASAFSKKVKLERDTLEKAGITVNFDSSGSKGTWVDIIKKN